jgi:hypothetical protein
MHKIKTPPEKVEHDSFFIVAYRASNSSPLGAYFLLASLPKIEERSVRRCEAPAAISSSHPN